MNKKRGRRRQAILSVFVIVEIIIASAVLIANLSVGELPYDAIEQDSNGNYHKVFIDNSTGNYEIYYMNDIGGDFPQDWDPPIKISNTTTNSSLLDLGIYLPTDTMFIIWFETDGNVNSTGHDKPTYYTISRDYGVYWTEPRRIGQRILLKYAEFDPLVGEPYIPNYLKANNTSDPYEYYIVQQKTPTIQEWYDGIKAVGGIFCGYIPNLAYIVWMNDTVKEQVKNLPYIRWIGYYHPAYKILSGLLEKDGIIELNVLVFEETGGQENLNKVISVIDSLGGYILYNGSSNNIIQIRINAEKIDDVAVIPEVEWIEEEGELWPRKPIPLHHINIIDDGPRSFNISDAHNFTSVGWDDELEDDLNRSWQPVWTVEGNVGKIIGDGYTVTFKATKPGIGKIICTDENTGYNASIEIQVEGEVVEQEFPWMWILLIGTLIIIAVLLAIIVFRKKKKSQRT